MNLPFVYNEQQVAELAENVLVLVGQVLVKQDSVIIGLTGDLGAGKTTLCKEILKQLKVSGPVVSPTFILRKDYEGQLQDKELKIIHIDAYRLEIPQQIKQVLEIPLKPKTLVIIEWAELADLKYDLHFKLLHIDEKTRGIVLL